MTIMVNSKPVNTTPRFWKWMNECALYRAGTPTFERPCTLTTSTDSVIVAMHLLAYTSIKYPMDYYPRAVGAINGYTFGAINLVLDDGEMYAIYQSSRTAEKEQVSLMHLATNAHVYSIRKMKDVTLNVTEPVLVKDQHAVPIVKDNVSVTLDKYITASGVDVPMGTPA